MVNKMRQGEPDHKTSISQVKIGFRLNWTFLHLTWWKHWVVTKVDNAIHRINHYPVYSVVCFVTITLIHRMAILPVGIVIQPTNNQGLVLVIGYSKLPEFSRPIIMQATLNYRKHDDTLGSELKPREESKSTIRCVPRLFSLSPIT